MGAAASLQTTITNIVNQTKINLENNAQASATSNCNIEIGSISFTNNMGCTMNIENRCSANAQASLDTISDTIKNVINQLDVVAKQKIAAIMTVALNVQTTVTNIEDVFELNIVQKCKTESQNNQNIKIMSLNFGECKSPSGVMNFTFVNSGQAAANCIMKIVNQVAVASSTALAVEQETGYDLNGVVTMAVYGAIAIAAFMCLYIFCKQMLVVLTGGTGYERLRLENVKKGDAGWFSRYMSFYNL